MKKSLYFILSLLVALSASAQNIDQELLKADQALNNFDFAKATKIYSSLSDVYPDNALIKERLATMYLTPGSYNVDMAMRYMEDAFKTGKMSPEMHVKYASLLESQNNYEKAIQVYSNLNRISFNKNSLMQLVNKDYYDNISKVNEGIIVKNLLDLNSSNSDFSPMYYREGLVFVSTRKNRSNTGFTNTNQVMENYSDLFFSKLMDPKIQTFEEPKVLLGNKDLKYMQGPVSFTDGYGVMYGTRSFLKDNNDNKALASSQDKRTVLLEVYKSNYKADINDWTDNSSIVLNKNNDYQNFSYAHPAFANGVGTELIFASNMPGGYGGTDLYYTQLIGNEWTTPVNLGPDVNTQGQEMFPYVAKDGTLYYSSNGLPGLGGLDIFKATGAQGKYKDVTNMGAPFNSVGDDFGYIVKEGNGEGYLTSNRTGGKGDDDIYYWRLNECKSVIKVYASATNEPIANAVVKVPCTNKTFNTDERGLVSVNCSDIKSCDIVASSDGYINKKMAVKDISTNRIINIPLDKDYSDKCKFVVMVMDKDSKEPISDATVSVRQVSSNDEVSGKSKSDGSLKVGGVEANEKYEISATKINEDGSRYIGNGSEASCNGKETEPVVKYIYLSRVSVGSKIKIDNIYYDVNKWDIKPQAARELDNIVSIMRQNPTMEIEMGSHTDCRATMKYNENLSSKRAESAAEYIISRGIPRSRITSKGYGESELVNGCACEGNKKSNCTDAEHQANRRTEFKIIKL